MEKVLGALIQARMGSRRLPGKVLKKVQGRTLLSYLIERVRSAKHLKEIVVATSDLPQDDAIAEECESLGVDYFRGSEPDVLDRFYKAAIKYSIDPIVRITADCPLVMPDLIDRMCEYFLEHRPDYLGHLLPYPEGLADMSMIPFSSLEAAWKRAFLPSDREYMVTFIFNRPEEFKVTRLAVESNLNDYRLTVDEDRDFTVVKHVIETLYDKPKKIFGMKEIEEYVDKYPEIVNINKHIPRNEGYARSLVEDEEWKKKNA